MQNEKIKSAAKSSKKSFKSTKKRALACIQTHLINEGIITEFKKMQDNNNLIDECVLLVDNRAKIIDTELKNGVLECELFGTKVKCLVFDESILSELELPLLPNAGNISHVLWYNTDYFFYILRKFFADFDNYWLFEYDCFYNAPNYHTFFDKFKDKSEDLLVPCFRKNAHNDGWCWSHNVEWFYPSQTQLYGSFFPIKRLSQRAIDELYFARLEANKAFEAAKNPKQWLFCEIFAPTQLMLKGFSVAGILENEPIILHEIDLNSNRIFENKDYKMYHAVKGNFLQRLADKDKAFEAERAKFRGEITNLNNEIVALKNELNALPRKISEQELINLRLDESVKKLEVKKLEKELGMKLSKLEPRVNLILSENLRNSAVARVRNHLAYRLGAAIIICNKSLWGLVSLPFVLSFIKAQYKKEQAAYQTLIKQKPEFKLPKIETYPDYKAALKEKECFTYKLGEAMMRADKTWYKFGYVKFYFEAKRLENLK